MPCFFAKASARPWSRAATAVTTASGWFFTGKISARGAILAAPRIPNRNGDAVGSSGTGGLNTYGPSGIISANRAKTGYTTNKVEPFHKPVERGHDGESKEEEFGNRCHQAINLSFGLDAQSVEVTRSRTVGTCVCWRPIIRLA